MSRNLQSCLIVFCNSSLDSIISRHHSFQLPRTWFAVQRNKVVDLFRSFHVCYCVWFGKLINRITMKHSIRPTQRGFQKTLHVHGRFRRFYTTSKLVNCIIKTSVTLRLLNAYIFKIQHLYYFIFMEDGTGTAPVTTRHLASYANFHINESHTLWSHENIDDTWKICGLQLPKEPGR